MLGGGGLEEKELVIGFYRPVNRTVLPQDKRKTENIIRYAKKRKKKKKKEKRERERRK